MFFEEKSAIKKIKGFRIPPKLYGHETELMHLYQSNKTRSEIATYFNVCPATVSYHLKKLKVSNA